MNETDKLKKERQEAWKRTKTEEVRKMLLQLAENYRRAQTWARRAQNLTVITALSYFVVLLLNDWLGNSEFVTDLTHALINIVLIVAGARWVVFLGGFLYWDGRLDGTKEVLDTFGIWPWEDEDEDEDGDGDESPRRSKKSSPLKRFKEFWERMRSANPKEQYA